MKKYRIRFIKNDNRCYSRVVNAKSINEARSMVPHRITSSVRINEVGAVIND